ncbi:Eukaryotic aspartyl protease family protein [Perilla frutescens var. hirtella]|nr:Eukaryotic aspartyl protease family protein [Perilla frutescens var. hirtella]KAH6805783.1 Eukaryotic aspartyl protease family protein [Perilla frutescens var. frutescens]
MVFKDSVVVLLILAVCWISFQSSEGYGSFGFDVHHRYSDTVKDFLDVKGLPEKDSLDYFAAMAHRDHLFKARRLATTPASSPFLTFFGGNETYQLASLGFLHYSVVSVGTPPSTYLVALDTGSDLFWLPCDCTTCVRSLNTTSGKPLELSIYSPNASSTATPVPCNSTMCGRRRACALRRNACAYQEVYLSSNTSSTGILVDDVLVLATDENPKQRVNAPITLGCGIIQTGDFIDGAAINGLFGLGLDNISVPSTLASKGLAANSFSMCFGPDGIGRIEFGDKGTPDQKTTPINVESSHPTYNVTVTEIVVGKNASDVEFTAIFDSGTSFTYLNDPAYSVIAKSFDSQVTEPRYQPMRKIIFDYCYSLSSTQDSYFAPDLNLTFKGGDLFYVNMPTIVIPRQGGGYAFCLAIVKSEDIDIIGQNFMTGYRMVFDREEMVLGWSNSNCYDDTAGGSNTLPVNKGNNSSDAPPPSILDPVATPGSRNRSSVSSPPPPSPLPLRPPFGNGAARFSSTTSNGLLMVVVAIFFQHFIILSS